MTPASFSSRNLILATPGVFYITILLFAFFAISDARFFSGLNLTHIGLQSSTLLIIALPMTLIIMSEGIDLSQGPVIGLCGIAMAMILADGGHLAVGILAAVAVGLAFGLWNGVLVSLLRLPPFVVTLSSFGLAWGLALAVTDGDTIVGLGEDIRFFYSGTIAGLPAPVVVAGLAYGLAHYLLYHTRFGAYVFAIGGNREALVLAGVKVHVYHVAIYAFGGAMVGLASLLMTARMNSGHPTVAIGLEFDAIAAVILGGTSFERGEGWLFGTLLGVVALGILRNGLNLLAIPSPLQVVSIGLLVILSLVIETLKVRHV